MCTSVYPLILIIRANSPHHYRGQSRVYCTGLSKHTVNKVFLYTQNRKLFRRLLCQILLPNRLAKTVRWLIQVHFKYCNDLAIRDCGGRDSEEPYHRFNKLETIGWMMTMIIIIITSISFGSFSPSHAFRSIIPVFLSVPVLQPPYKVPITTFSCIPRARSPLVP
jgi:hypothetical protein